MDCLKKDDSEQDNFYPQEEDFLYDCFQIDQDIYDDFLDINCQEYDFDLNQTQFTSFNANDTGEIKEGDSAPLNESNCISSNEFYHFSPNFDKKSFQVKRKRKESEKVQLTPNGTIFRKKFYRFLTHGMKKIARKELILKYHGMICQRYSFIRDVQRDEYRSIKKYFNKHADQEAFILKALQELKIEGLLNYEQDLRSLTSMNY